MADAVRALRIMLRSLARRPGVAQGLRLVAIGLVAGLVIAVFATRLLTSLLYDVRPTDPLTLGAVTVLALATATLAAWLPARRAAHIEPMRVIREE
jgi:putative ABC transport system permease protein